MMGGKEIIERIKAIMLMVKSGNDEKAILYMHYLIEDVEMYKRNSL
jgi:hypothetical protein|tara:strand:+ start:281 stop:418 length:138 start_codon:yes stop_codon:yes gene_type:complete